MLALDSAHYGLIGRRHWDQEHSILPAILCLAKHLNGTPENLFADLRTQILKGLPADAVQRQIGPRPFGAASILIHISYRIALGVRGIWIMLVRIHRRCSLTLSDVNRIGADPATPRQCPLGSCRRRSSHRR